MSIYKKEDFEEDRDYPPTWAWWLVFIVGTIVMIVWG